MARIEEAMVIKCPADKLFAYMADTKTWPRWYSGLVKAEQTSTGQMGVGTAIQGEMKAMGRTMALTAKVTEYEPSKKWEGSISLPGMQLEEHFTFDSIGGSTKLTRVYDAQLHGLLKLLAPMVLSSMRRGSKKSLANLKSILEAQTLSCQYFFV
jgi:uncharacterized protein YndB with AHSA1/START domain